MHYDAARLAVEGTTRAVASDLASASRFAFLSCAPQTLNAKNKAIIKLCGHFSSYLSVAQLLVLRPQTLSTD